MAKAKLINNVKVLDNKINTTKTWQSYTLSNDNVHSGYFIGLKDTKVSKGCLDRDKVKSITFELGIDSGAPGLIISLGNFVLDFSVRTSDDSVTNARTAKHRFNEVPTTFWYRAVQIVTTDGNIVSEEVETDIALNLLEIKM